ncbi:MAG: AAA family ATPase [Clostridiales bacterium]|nr:AAA family ATPase [Clostridiales bacterium]
MLEFVELKITNFGPYKDTQVIKFDKGVTIIWGDNGRGKTILLNAFRYALLGIVKERSKQKKNNLISLCNWENIEQGIYEFSVQLSFKYNGEPYELRRKFQLRPGIVEPKSDNDFEEEVFLQKSNSIVSQNELRQQLTKIMPEQVSRFFLFDGELLSEYEDLLDNNRAISSKIKDSIEKILGVPILINALNDVNAEYEKINKQYLKIANKNESNSQIIGALESANVKLSHLQRSYNLYTKEKETEIQRKKIIEVELSRTERVRAQIENKNKLLQEINSNEERRIQLQATLKEYSKDAWLVLLNPIVKEKLLMIDKEIKSLEHKQYKEANITNEIKKLSQAIHSNLCPTCHRDLEEENKLEINNKIKLLKETVIEFTDSEKSRLEYLQRNKTILRAQEVQNIKELINNLNSQIDDLTVKIIDSKGKVNEINQSIGKPDQYETIANLNNDHAIIINNIRVLDDTITRIDRDIAETNSNINILTKKIDNTRIDNELQNILTLKESVLSLRDLFKDGISIYRDKLREKVQLDASMLFRRISHEKDFVDLVINDNYGLNILYRDGKENVNRSAGYEHIIAISLIGALQQNAPLSGPIVMDSPFGRLDEVHSKNISAALGSLSHQVILLAYEGEIDVQFARHTLGSGLSNEYKLERISGKHTKIVEFREKT